MIKKILIANRGEIACRIIKTANKLKIKTVSIYSDSDINAEHVLMSDESYYLGPSEASKSYLNISKIIEICKKAEVDAVHPGYGFLSENPNFVRELTKNKIIFIGHIKLFLFSSSSTFLINLDNSKLTESLVIPFADDPLKSI